MSILVVRWVSAHNYWMKLDSKYFDKIRTRRRKGSEP
ncbi:MAG TPA: molecular chaperone DnaJ, partial [Rhizobium sp.]|nr:molecular chaperone DnaJ [Rhizobium sp.]